MMIGTCQDIQCIENIFSSVSEFALQVEEHGDDFVYQDIEVVYDIETDIHTFYRED